jgi:hypothetical protein
MSGILSGKKEEKNSEINKSPEKKTRKKIINS